MAKVQKELSKALLDVLACPKCKGDLDYRKKQGKLVCKNKPCAREYRIENGIPIMLADES
ncbi:MAG: Trm112 family protein [Candidatus Diapherotrites archaeon]